MVLFTNFLVCVFCAHVVHSSIERHEVTGGAASKAGIFAGLDLNREAGVFVIVERAQSGEPVASDLNLLQMKAIFFLIIDVVVDVGLCGIHVITALLSSWGGVAAGCFPAARMVLGEGIPIARLYINKIESIKRFRRSASLRRCFLRDRRGVVFSGR